MIAATSCWVKRGKIVPSHMWQPLSRAQTGTYALLGLLATLPYNVLRRLDRLVYNYKEGKTCKPIA